MSAVAGIDVGATSARVHIVEEGGETVTRTLETGRYADAAGLLREALGGAVPQALCLAVAGPVDAGKARLTNGDLHFDQRELQQALRVPRLQLVNDLAALAHELRHLEASQLTPLGAAPRGPGACAALAPGTGLGMVVVGAGGEVVPSEGGHAPLAPADPLEQELHQALAGKLGYVSWEDVLSGAGLVNLYGAVCEVWGSQPQAIDAGDVTASAVSLADPVCHQTLETWCAILGSAAGALAVTACAAGGVFIGGGIVPRIASFVQGSGFRRRFEERGKMSGYVSGMATHIVKDDAAGLAGAVRCARAMMQPGWSGAC